jgi:hypothetical protein
MTNILNEKEKNHLREILQKEGVQACLKEANNNLEGMMICEDLEAVSEKIDVYIWNNTTGTLAEHIILNALDRHREENMNGDFFYHIRSRC